MNALRIDERDQVRKQEQIEKGIEREDFPAHPLMIRGLRSRIYRNLISFLIIVATIVVAAIVGAYLK